MILNQNLLDEGTYMGKCKKTRVAIAQGPSQVYKTKKKQI